MALQSLKALMQQVAALSKQVAALASLTDLAQIVHADADGNVTLTLPARGSFALRQGNTLRIAVDNRGNVALFGAEAGIFREGGGQANVNAGGLHLNAPGNKASLWLQPDGTILVVGDFQIDLSQPVTPPVIPPVTPPNEGGGGEDGNQNGQGENAQAFSIATGD